MEANLLDLQYSHDLQTSQCQGHLRQSCEFSQTPFVVSGILVVTPRPLVVFSGEQLNH